MMQVDIKMIQEDVKMMLVYAEMMQVDVKMMCRFPLK